MELGGEYVKKLTSILLCFKTKKKIDLDKLEKLCFKTYEDHYTIYPWARLSPTVHKLLRHGCEIARQFSLPISYYSEDSSEAWHKHNRRNMRDHARQSSCVNRITDVFNYAIYYSDPKISLTFLNNRLKFQKLMEIPNDLEEYILR